MNNQFEPRQENGLSAILEVYRAHLEGTVLSQSSVVKAVWLVYCVTVRSHSRIRWSLIETLALRVIKIKDFCMAVQKLHFYGLDCHSRTCSISEDVASHMMHKVLTGLSPMQTVRSLPIPFFDSVSLLHWLLPWLFLHWWWWGYLSSFLLPCNQFRSKGSRIIGQLSVRPILE